MDPKNACVFCRLCGNKITLRNNNRLTCSNKHHTYINPIPSNAVILENDRGEILLVKRKFSPKKGWWDLPGGFIQPGETIEYSVLREIKEELGVEMKMTHIIGIYPDKYLYQSVLEPTLTIVVAGKIIKGAINPKDDVSDFMFLHKKKVLKQKVAFAAVEKGIKDYLTN